MAKKDKFYVVWNGVTPGIYLTWNECKAQINGFKGAIYKSFDTLAAAKEAYASPAWIYTQRHRTEKSKEKPSADSVYIFDSLSVDAACSGNPGVMEYRGVYIRTQEEIFRVGPMLGTNNIGEFLALVHGLALIQQRGSDIPLYSDSQTAISWVRQKKCKTTLPRNAKTTQVYELIDRAERWLQTHTYTTKIYKWETEIWGEIPADFGRK